ncbi:diacylglycerol/lipid kinase family protein [Mesonia mobilis]|uniref:Diacylglycerol kinase n=1 Tax=Mesonia mobilis TaxID=369791 RepID=A0ABQ3BM47_9FLAO|nr:YegS/Rv2252/BmrU family lipid kinase [Mesonia mobilis]MBQ0736905.1 YegS/Rv2252/BmrU family lipid kinase [Aquimarina celericrescens]GGZ51393.1 diacylglycerol kinase [Mesonia mobilis]
MQFLFIINPISGNEDKSHLLRMVKAELKTDDKLTIFKTTGENDTEKIQQQLKKENFDRVLVAGGDGTIKLAAEAMGENALPIGILPAGSANGLASDLDLPEQPKKFIPIALYGKTRKIDAININDELGLHISDFGLNAELIKEYESSSLRGKLGYAINSITTLFQSKGPYEFEISTEKESFTKKGIMLALANSKKFGTGAVVNPKGKIDDGIFEVLLFKKLDLFEILKTLNEGKELSSDFVESFPVKEVKIKTQQKVDFQIDGEYCKAISEVNAKILPNKLEIAVRLG